MDALALAVRHIDQRTNLHTEDDDVNALAEIASELVIAAAAGSAVSHSTSEAMYLDPEAGATWSGRGRATAWIKDAKNRDRFLIQG
ncbi:hypothetical protein DPV79_23645 [Burkholderia reimsis]|uniref:DNA-binding protein H-NS-like C-terminal domain-containing protein n=1 Tax=Burkholderia reimsis TaxID=2234132 RepID=A0A365QRW6_9BURK|nr:H-NS family nucleoid-associated regulatory protein [Burkholderia reimsis]RBB36996.1 hypothetical protein DPV79_23645 [Burkholderia reimsis]